VVAAAQERRIERARTLTPPGTPGGGPKLDHSIVARLCAILFAFAALRAFAASFIIGNNEVDVTNAERAREFE
jgi:hypothetical protein